MDPRHRPPSAPGEDRAIAIRDTHALAGRTGRLQLLEMDSERVDALLQVVPDAALCGIYVYDLVAGHNDYINAEYTRLTGWTLDEINAMSGDEFAALFHADDRETVFAHMAAVAAAEDGEAVEIEYRFRHKDGHWVWCLSRDTPLERGPDGEVSSFIGTFLDITDRAEREEARAARQHALEHSQRLESLGVLAGGIAHDFNNILMAIMGHTSLALGEVSPVSPVRDHLSGINVAAGRAADLCRQMLAYAGRGPVERTDFGLTDLIQEMLHILETSISKKCVLRVMADSNIPDIHADPSQVQQIVLNLVLNASEAIGDRSGVITVTSGAMDCSPEYLDGNYIVEPLDPGLYVYLEVADSGTGMDDETIDRIFEPFYTTKFTGRGLGLSAVVGIVRSHDGGLRVYSEEGKGSTFKVLFPASLDSAREEAAPADALSSWRGRGTVLLVDDEETVRGVCASQLRSLGLDVLTAVDGRDGVAVFRERSAEIDLVILDLTMPRMSGEEAFREMRSMDDEIPVVLASGYSEHDVTSRFAGKRLAGFLQKPYSLARLREVLAGVLPAREPEVADRS